MARRSSTSAGSLRSTSTKIDERQRLDEELGECEVGGTVEGEQHTAAVTAETDEDHAGQTVAHHRGGERGRDHHQPDHELHRRIPQPDVGARFVPTTSSTSGTTTRVPRMVAWVSGSEPRWVAPVSRIDSASMPRSVAS